MHPFVAEHLVADHQARAHEAARQSRLVRSVSTARPRSPRAQFSWPSRLAAVLVLGVTLLAFTDANALFDSGPSRPGVRTKSVTLVGLTPLGVERVDYEPGASRAWAANEHIVAVAVVAGMLTVYGPADERHVYTAGEGYAAGWTAYRTVNETEEPVETWVVSHARP